MTRVPGRLLALAALTLALLTGCEKAKTYFGRVTLPDMGPKLPMTVKMEFDPGLTNSRLPYINVCNAPKEIRIGQELEAVLLQAAAQNFRGVQFAGAAPLNAKPDISAEFALQQSSLNIQTDNIYDRLPGQIILEATVAFRDANGKLLGERTIKSDYKDRLIVEPTQHRCDLVSMESFAANASVALALQFVREARALLDPDGSRAASSQAAPTAPPTVPPPQMAATPPAAVPSTPPPSKSTLSPATNSAASSAAGTGATIVPVPVPAPVPAVPPVPGGNSPAISFKASLFDENANGILEPGEQVKVRVEVVNTGLGKAQGVKVRVNGTPALVDQFPADTLPAGDLQPGESRSLAFVGSLPQGIQAQQAELVVTVTESTGSGVPSSRTLFASIKPADEPRSIPSATARTPSPPGREGPETKDGQMRTTPRSDDIDELPPPPTDFRQPDAYVLSIGLGAYRDGQTPPRKFAVQDTELVAGYFQALGGIPSENIRILQDRRALRPDIEEAVLDWLPSHVTPESIIIVYFAGQAVVTQSGDVYLIPYEGNRNSVGRLYPVKDLQAALGKLKTRLTLFIFDGSVLRLGADAKTKANPSPPRAPQWEKGSKSILRLLGTTGLQKALEPEQLHHGLFTYYLLRGLRGEADENQDGAVSLLELNGYVSDSVSAAAKSTYRGDQQPVLVPSILPTSKRGSLPLTRYMDGAIP